MAELNSGDVRIHYEVYGAGRAIVLVHGVTSSFKRNFYNPGWVSFLTEHDFQVIGLDLRGHGESEKLYDPGRYRPADFTADLVRLLDQLHLSVVDMLGYSMGGYVTLDFALEHPERVRRLVLGGIGDRVLNAGRAQRVPGDITTALEAASAEAIADPVLRQYRVFAEQTGSDIRALRALMRGPFWAPRDVTRIRQIAQPVLVIVGADDGIAGSAMQLAQTIPGARLVTIPNRNHFTAVGDKRSMEAVTNFLTVQG